MTVFIRTVCMEQSCNDNATRFEADDSHWHDWVWCDKHAAGRPTEPLVLDSNWAREHEEALREDYKDFLEFGHDRGDCEDFHSDG